MKTKQISQIQEIASAEMGQELSDAELEAVTGGHGSLVAVAAAAVVVGAEAHVGHHSVTAGAAVAAGAAALVNHHGVVAAVGAVAAAGVAVS